MVCVVSLTSGFDHDFHYLISDRVSPYCISPQFNCAIRTLGGLVRPPDGLVRSPQAQQTLVWTPWCVPSMGMSQSPALAVLHQD